MLQLRRNVCVRFCCCCCCCLGGTLFQPPSVTFAHLPCISGKSFHRKLNPVQVWIWVRWGLIVSLRCLTLYQSRYSSSHVEPLMTSSYGLCKVNDRDSCEKDSVYRLRGKADCALHWPASRQSLWITAHNKYALMTRSNKRECLESTHAVNRTSAFPRLWEKMFFKEGDLYALSYNAKLLGRWIFCPGEDWLQGRRVTACVRALHGCQDTATTSVSVSSCAS